MYYFLAYFYFKICAMLDFKIKITLYGSTFYFIPVTYKFITKFLYNSQLWDAHLSTEKIGK
jgi:hypothetical protein